MSSDPKSGKQNEKKGDGDPNTKHIESGSPTILERKAARNCPKKLWKKAFDGVRSVCQKKGKEQSRPTTPPSDANASTETSKGEQLVQLIEADLQRKGEQLVQLIEADLDQMRSEADDLTKYNSQLASDLKTLGTIFEDIKKIVGGEKVEKLNKLRKGLMKVKLAIPSKSNIRADKDEKEKNLKFLKERICGEESKKKMPQLHQNLVFETSMEFKDFEDRYYELDDKVKLCLLCLSIFPQGATIKKRLLMRWWIVEGFASDEEDAKAKFKEVMDKGFIEAVNDNRSPSVGSCRLHPFHRSVLVALAERAKMFNFGSGGDPTQSFGGCFQACLMGAGLISYNDFKKKNQEEKGEADPIKVVKGLVQELEKLHLLLNVDEHILEFVGEWFGKMKNLNILYLGRWKALATHHIEVEEPKFFKELGNMKYVKFLSLQGVSNIIALDHSILELSNLQVLDLRACFNLETIPERIEKLKKLQHLDMSECYLLAHMPKGLSKLKELKVLKGFFVSKDDPTKSCCTIQDLQNLSKLEKLCIYTEWADFPLKEHVVGLEKLTELTKLTITWGVSEGVSKGVGKGGSEGGSKGVGEGGSEGVSKGVGEGVSEGGSKGVSEKNSPKKTPAAATAKEGKKGKGTSEPQPPPANLPSKLEKLDLKCFPKEDTPSWLKLENLQSLQKLYIRGGKFRDLGQYQGSDESAKKWNVKELRLKYLGQMEMEWRQLQELFPKLEYLEKLRCPNLTLFPCDAKGVWIKQRVAALSLSN